MKFNAKYVIPVVILVVVVIISLCQSCAYFMPYDSEGYENISMPLGTGDASYASEKKSVSGAPNSATDQMNSAISNNQFTSGPMNGSFNAPSNEFTSGPMNDSLSNSFNQPMNQFTSGPMTGAMNDSLNQPMNQFTSGPMNGSFSSPLTGTNYTPIPGSYDSISQAASAPSIRSTFAGRESFATLNEVSAEYKEKDHALDIYSQAKGSMSCESGPYSNSMGYLCMDDKQNKQLQSRGGNQTGRI
jgi:hypothetical protein